MEQYWSTVGALLLALIACEHSDIALATNKATKPGVCPIWNGFGMCHQFCRFDTQCPNVQKCCSNGCGMQCMRPYEEKPGVCPPEHGASICSEACSQDGQCERDQKCCKTCGHACRDPVLV
ncbi:WAP four-disulfide core domain protein 18-like [Pseudoliparis swirei]|uniref:WAP four-disulfide core domain protein 18-like n=1 Tax=Pseudoliparis swirei TaxID=2059687 RepID=UPI0024BE4C71|nr:WAP four-disulfide core domain protein 18-like [Pseudoliparis swirei]